MKEDERNRRNQAARVITRNVSTPNENIIHRLIIFQLRKYCIRRSIEKYGKRKVGLKRRLELIGILDERLAKSVDMRRKSIKEIERRVRKIL